MLESYLRWFDRLGNAGSFYGNTAVRWLIAGVVAAVVFLLLPPVIGLVRKRVETLATRFAKRWLDALAVVLKQTKVWFLFLLALWIGSLLLKLPNVTLLRIRTAITLAFLIQVGVWGQQLIQFFVERTMKERLSEHPAEVTTMAALGFVGKLVLYTVVLLLMLDNLGVDVTALIAGLGVGGIAIALAAQNILGDLFSSMSIVLDKPFVLGDFIIVGDMMGSVERIGLKTTRIRSLSGEQLILSNTDLLQSRIRNFKRMRERRVVFSIGVTYDTTPQQLEEIPQIIQEAIQARGETRFDRAHFSGFGDSALLFEIVYYVLQSDYNIYMDIQQAINLHLVKRFAEQQIEFAFPTQTIYLQSETTPGTAPPESTE